MEATSNKKKNPTIFLLFGGSGDLSKRKVIPALFNLFLDNWLPEKFAILASSRTKLTDEKYREELLTAVNKFSRRGKAKKEDWANFSAHIIYLAADIKNAADYKLFSKAIDNYKKEWEEPPCIIYYCAVAPQLFETIAENIEKSKLENDPKTTRIIIEKPFGKDLQSAQTLNQKLLSIFEENQIYRIDHYLGKEVVQNIMAFRFANTIMEPLWNRNHIEHIQISVTEEIGIGSRGGYFEKAGILRDMVQNHLFQLLCIVAMEPPINLEPDEVRDRKVDVLKAMRKIEPGNIEKIAARGQYNSGWVKGKEVKGYREEKDVDPNSNTETYAALKLHIDNWRWQGVPFYLRTGKRLFKTASVITIQFHEVSHNIFKSEGFGIPQKNRLVINIQPDMAIRFQLQNKIPGLEMNLNTVDIAFDYCGDQNSDTPEAYETLLLDTINGDQTLFMRADQVEAAWKFIAPIMDYWEKNHISDFPNYSANSWGPEKAEALIAKDGYHWLNFPEKNKTRK